MIDVIIKEIDERFSQETINVTKMVKMLINLKIYSADLNILSQRLKYNKNN